MDGNPKGAHVIGLFGFENNVFPIVANGPKPIRNQMRVTIHARGTSFFLSGDNPETDWINLWRSVFRVFWSRESGNKNENKKTVIKLKKIPQPAL